MQNSSMRGCVREGIKISRFHVDLADLDPEMRALAHITLEKFRSIAALEGHIYLNPAFTLTASAGVPEIVFLREARQACLLWIKQLNDAVGIKHVKRFQRKLSDAGDRMLITSGILILAGEMAHINRLNEAASNNSKSPGSVC